MIAHEIQLQYVTWQRSTITSYVLCETSLVETVTICPCNNQAVSSQSSFFIPQLFTVIL